MRVSAQEATDDLARVDAIVLALGTDDDVVYSKTGSSQVWLLGYALTDTIVVLAEKKILVLASKKKIDFLKPLESGKENEKDIPPVTLILRNKVGAESDWRTCLAIGAVVMCRRTRTRPTTRSWWRRSAAARRAR